MGWTSVAGCGSVSGYLNSKMYKQYHNDSEGSFTKVD
jgi:hypothetical protein